jgi:hypothetical protein
MMLQDERGTLELLVVCPTHGLSGIEIEHTVRDDGMNINTVTKAVCSEKNECDPLFWDISIVRTKSSS